jgi:heme/copper-type cytochrome/quinol oxidase subunit 3
MVFAVRASSFGDTKGVRNWLLATMICGTAFVVLHGREWSHLISEGLTLSVFPAVPGAEAGKEFSEVSKTVPQFPSTFFGLTGMHMLHVTLGVIYLGVIAFRRKFIPVLLVLWLAAWLGTPAYSPFHYLCHVILLATIVVSIILWLKPKLYDSSDVEVAGLYWHFVDLVWMFIFPLVYLMSTRIL